MTNRAVHRSGAAAAQVTTSLFRALAVGRIILMAYVVTLNVVRFGDFERPVLAVMDLAVLVLWTGFVTWAYDAPQRRRPVLFVLDLTVAVVLVLSTPLVQSQEMLDRHASTMPSFWVAGAVLAFSAGRGWVEAVCAAVVVSLADLSVRTEVTGGVWGNIIILLLISGLIGYAAGLLRDAVEVRAEAERAAAAYEERARLARVVHDGVLQVLALVQRRGTGAGGDLEELARLAGEQEVALRALVHRDARPSSGAWQADLMASLEALGRTTVTVTGPGHAVNLPAHVAEELTAVVRQCLDNVARHVGEDAPAWVFVEDLGSDVVVSVRDDGPGIEPGRLDRAEQEGRLGVSASIRGRMRDLGGSAVIRTAAGHGVEWELTVAR